MIIVTILGFLGGFLPIILGVIYGYHILMFFVIVIPTVWLGIPFFVYGILALLGIVPWEESSE